MAYVPVGQPLTKDCRRDGMPAAGALTGTFLARMRSELSTGPSHSAAVWAALQTDPPHPIRNLLPPPGMLDHDGRPA